ncbi:Protein kinase [Spraguea lophii 42_110]|uniref:Protein kinase n=1 Tax=Spraguea lophii (strain 42_110) TaxID=1358809 RepID=S7WAJ4_SPRLO|nr:Protein kinase [Spraguea lophii 42_110]
MINKLFSKLYLSRIFLLINIMIIPLLLTFIVKKVKILNKNKDIFEEADYYKDFIKYFERGENLFSVYTTIDRDFPGSLKEFYDQSLIIGKAHVYKSVILEKRVFRDMYLVVSTVKKTQNNIEVQKLLNSNNCTGLSNLYCYYTRGDKLYRCQRYALGRKLDMVIKNLSVNIKLYILGKVFEAIKFLHKLDIVHTALTPFSIIVSGHEPTIIDFTKAKYLPLKPIEKINRRGRKMYYVAPELKNEGRVHKGNDWYSFAMLFYYLFEENEDNISEGLNFENLNADNFKAAREFIKTVLNEEDPEEREDYVLKMNNQHEVFNFQST